MQKVILAPDSFKGTMSAEEICKIMEEELHGIMPDCAVYSVPIADGGEGTVSCFLRAMPGKTVSVKVRGPFGEPVKVRYALCNGGKTAVVESASAAGLPLVEGCADPERTTTYGVGEQLRDAVERGATHLILGMGGSCTNDGGCGVAAALGVRFFDAEGTEFLPTGGTLSEIARVDLSAARSLLSGVRVQAMCDVANPLYGENGAAYVFAPQKGADAEAVRRLDEGLRAYGAVLEALPGNAGICAVPGSGAAGGLGAGMKGLLGAELTSGIDTVLDAVGFDTLLDGCDLILTGEGRIDGQSLGGKAVMGVARRAAERGVPVCAIVGDALDHTLEPAYAQGLTAVIPINRQALSFEQARPRAKEDLRATVRNLLRLLQSQE